MYSISSQRGKPQYGILDFVIDNAEDINTLPTDVMPGSTAFAIDKSETYMLNNQKQWIKISKGSGGGGSDIKIENLDVTENGTYTAESGKAYGTVNVNVENEEDPLDPIQVYKNTRPSNWLKMPQPQNEEIYFLIDCLEDVGNNVDFTVSTNNNTFKVEVGYTEEDGIFIPIDELTEIISGTSYSKEYTDSSHNEQLIIKITSLDGGNITGFNAKNGDSLYNPVIKTPILEFSGGNLIECNSLLIECTSCLKYFSLGKNKIYSAVMFYNCYSLITIPQLDTSNFTSMSQLFYGCYSLISIPQLDTSNVTSMQSMFDSCYSLTSIPQLDTNNVTSMSNMFSSCFSLVTIPPIFSENNLHLMSTFSGCYSLISLPPLNTDNIDVFYRTFSECRSLNAVLELNISKAETCMDMFSNCNSLQKLTFKQLENSIPGQNISLKNCKLGYKALLIMINSLPTVTTTRTLILTGNPGVSSLTDEDKIVVTNKGWTLTL